MGGVAKTPIKKNISVFEEKRFDVWDQTPKRFFKMFRHF